jgi:LEA14-like dessication related protein
MLGNHAHTWRRIGSLRTHGTLVVAASLAPACAFLQRVAFDEPTIELSAVRIRSVDLRGGTLDVLLAVHNPNPYRIRGSRFEGEIQLENSAFGTVARESPWELPAGADTTLALRLDFAWSAVGAAARGLLERGAVGYRLAGRVLIGTPADERWIQISRDGRVPLEHLRP